MWNELMRQMTSVHALPQLVPYQNHSRSSAQSHKSTHVISHDQLCNQASNVQIRGFSRLHSFSGPFSGTPRKAGIKKVKPIWILLKQETVSGSGISWAMCKSAPRSIQITMLAPHHLSFYRPDALPAAQPTNSKALKFNSPLQQNNNNTRLMALFRDYPGKLVQETRNQSGFY